MEFEANSLNSRRLDDLKVHTIHTTDDSIKTVLKLIGTHKKMILSLMNDQNDPNNLHLVVSSNDINKIDDKCNFPTAINKWRPHQSEPILSYSGSPCFSMTRDLPKVIRVNSYSFGNLRGINCPSSSIVRGIVCLFRGSFSETYLMSVVFHIRRMNWCRQAIDCAFLYVQGRIYF